MWTPCMLPVLLVCIPGSPAYHVPRLLVEQQELPRTAVVELEAGSEAGVTGNLTLVTVNRPFRGVVISGTILGLNPGLHGFHVHMEGVLTNQCKDAKGHFNPGGAEHNGPKDVTRHAGDLGNILTYPTGQTPIYIIDSLITLGDGGLNDVAGRAIVVHAGEDDLGRGGDEESKKTGNAGSRAGCGVIKLL